MTTFASSIDAEKVYVFGKHNLPKNFIETGMKFTYDPADPLTLGVGEGKADISGQYQEIKSPYSLSLSPRKPALIYAK